MADNRATLQSMIDAMFAGDFETAGRGLAEDAVVEYPQSGERLVGREACLNVYRNYPGGSPNYQLRRITGGPDVFAVEGVGDYSGEKVYLASIVEFRDGKIVRQTDYFASPFPAPDWRAEWVQRA